MNLMYKAGLWILVFWSDSTFDFLNFVRIQSENQDLKLIYSNSKNAKS